MAKIPAGVGPRFPQVVVLVGATGDLSRRKLIPGLLHLTSAGFIPACRFIGVSLDALDAEGFRKFARDAHNEFSMRKIDDATIEAQMVIEDPLALKAPWHVTKRYRKLPAGSRAYDYACAENNRNPISESGETLTLDGEGNVIDIIEE